MIYQILLILVIQMNFKRVLLKKYKMILISKNQKFLLIKIFPNFMKTI